MRVAIFDLWLKEGNWLGDVLMGFFYLNEIGMEKKINQSGKRVISLKITRFGVFINVRFGLMDRKCSTST